MTPPDNSLNKYKNTLLTSGQPANNWNRPNLDYHNGGRLESTNYETIKSTTPKVYWNSYSSSDPILNFGSTSSSIKGGNFLNTLGTIATVATGVAGFGVSVFSVVNAVKASKSSSSNSNSSTPAADENLSSLTNTANNYDKKSDVLAMSNTATNLKIAIETSQKKLNNAKRTSETAQKTITNLNTKKTEWDGKRTDFITKRDELETNLASDKGALEQLKSISESERTPEQTAQIAKLEKSISDTEATLKKDYSDAKLKTIEDQIARIDKEIDKWTTTKLEADVLVKQLPNEIKEAQKALESLNKKINK